MTKLIQHIEEMRARLSQIATTEHSLVKDLADSVQIIDQQLLQDVRNVAAEHQSRRATILNELQALASSIGMFRSTQVAASTPQQISQQIDYGHQYGPGDWGQATQNLSLQEELEFQLNGLNGKGLKN